jgi:hypothetical protein
MQKNESRTRVGSLGQLAFMPPSLVKVLHGRRSIHNRSLLLPASNCSFRQLEEKSFAPQFDGRAPMELRHTQRLDAVPFLFIVLVDEEVKRTIDTREPADGSHFSQPANNHHAFDQLPKCMRDVNMLGLKLSYGGSGRIRDAPKGIELLVTDVESRRPPLGLFPAPLKRFKDLLWIEAVELGQKTAFYALSQSFNRVNPGELLLTLCDGHMDWIVPLGNRQRTLNDSKIEIRRATKRRSQNTRCALLTIPITKPWPRTLTWTKGGGSSAAERILHATPRTTQFACDN